MGRCRQSREIRRPREQGTKEGLMKIHSVEITRGCEMGRQELVVKEFSEFEISEPAMKQKCKISSIASEVRILCR